MVDIIMVEYGIMVISQEFWDKNIKIMKNKKSEQIFQILSILAVGAMVWLSLASVLKFIFWLLN